MAAAKIPAPGTQYGPCVDECKHLDCKASREQAAALCGLCKKPIGYETYWFVLRARVPAVGEAEMPAHEACFHDATNQPPTSRSAKVRR